MKRVITFFFIILLSGQLIYAIDAKPMVDNVKGALRPIKTSGPIKVNTITWGGDIATIYADQKGLFKKEGLSVKLNCENNFTAQVESCLSGETPYLRGTMGMINAAAEVFKDRGTELIVIYQLTWSTGGDCLVSRKGKTLKNIKTLSLQLYGPHMDYAANLFSNAKRLDQLSFKWFQELTLPTFDTQGKTLDPVSAFQEDKTIDGVMCIIPDGLMLTSNGTVGTGSDDSVKGAEIIVSTKTAGKIICDVYAVRKDYLDSNRQKVQKFIYALMKGEEQLRDLRKQAGSSEYKKLMSRSADLLLGAPEATADAEALLGDCEYVGYSGNVKFFSGKGTTRNFKNLNKEIQSAFKKMNIMRNNVKISHANFDYSKLAKGLSYTADKQKKKFDSQKVAAHIEEKISVETDTWEEDGTLFAIEINFEPNQSEFFAQQYSKEFKDAMSIAQTYDNALVIIEGHSDPLGIRKAEKKGETKAVISQMKQKAKNLSFNRSESVKKAFLKYCKAQGIMMDDSQFLPLGLGISNAKYDPPLTKQQWNANRRVVFRIKQMETELDEFSPL